MYLDHLQNWLVYGHGLLIFLILAVFWLSETGQIWGFRVFPGEHMEEIAWNFAHWCILSTSRPDSFMALVCWFFLFWHYFDLVKRVKFGVSGYFLENAWREWPEIWYAAVSWPHSELIRLWLQSGDFSNFWCYFDLVKRVKFGVSGHFPENAWREWPEILHADVSWPPSELISLWPRSVDFSNFGAILT